MLLAPLLTAMARVTKLRKQSLLMPVMMTRWIPSRVVMICTVAYTAGQACCRRHSATNADLLVATLAAVVSALVRHHHHARVASAMDGFLAPWPC